MHVFAETTIVTLCLLSWAKRNIGSVARYHTRIPNKEPIPRFSGLSDETVNRGPVFV